MRVRVPNASNNRNTAVLLASSQMTALVNGGKLNVISRPRKWIRSWLAHARISSRYLNSTFRQGHYGKAAMTLGVHSSYCKDDIILRKFQRGALNAANIFRVLPFWAGRPAPDNFVARSQTS